MIFREEYKLRSSSLWNFLHLSVTSTLCGLNIVFSTCFRYETGRQTIMNIMVPSIPWTWSVFKLIVIVILIYDCRSQIFEVSHFWNGLLPIFISRLCVTLWWQDMNLYILIFSLRLFLEQLHCYCLIGHTKEFKSEALCTILYRALLLRWRGF